MIENYMEIFNKVPTIRTEKLIYSKIDINDIHDLFDLFSDSEVTYYMGIQTVKNIDEIKEWLYRIEHEYTLNKSVEWSIRLSEDGQFVGRGGFKNLDFKHKKAEISGSILKKYWNKGIGKESLKAIIDYGFNNLCLHRIYSYLWPHNTRVIKILEQYGFNHEGTLKDNYFYNDKFGDSAIYALINN